MRNSQLEQAVAAFRLARSHTVEDILALGPEPPLSLSGNLSATADHVAPIDEAGEGAFAFCRNRGQRGRRRCAASAASIVVAPEALGELTGRCYIVVSDPLAWFAEVLRRLYPTEEVASIHPSAQIDERAHLGGDVHVGSNVVIGANVRVGDRTRLDAGVQLLNGCVIGKNCRIGAFSIVGGDGFSYYRTADRSYLTLPNLGTALIGDDVFIGSHCSVVRGVLSHTVIGNHCRIGNYVNVGHNCRVGDGAALYVGAVLCGSAVVEQDAVVAARAVINNEAVVGRGAKVGMNATVTRSVRPFATVFGSPARELNTIRRL